MFMLTSVKVEAIKSAALFGQTIIGSCHSNVHLEEMMRELIEEADRWDLEQKLASLWWASTYADEKNG